MLNTTELLKLSKSRHGWKVVVATHFRNTFWMFIWPIGGGLENGWVHSMRLQLDLPTRFLFRLGMDKGAGGLMRMSIRFCPGGGGKSNGLVSRLSGVVSFRLQATVFSNVILCRVEVFLKWQSTHCSSRFWPLGGIMLNGFNSSSFRRPRLLRSLDIVAMIQRVAATVSKA